MAVLEALPILTPDRRGYVLDGETHIGFADRPELSEERRRTLARWAAGFAPEIVAPAQAALLEAPARPAPEVAEAAQGLIDDRNELQQLHLGGVLDELTAEQREWLAHPGTHPDLDTAATFPLTVGEMAVLVGVENAQLRRWSDAGVLPSFRWGDDRRLGRSAAARAMVMASASKPEKAVICALARGEGRRTALMLGALLGDALARAGDDQEQRGELARSLRAAADTLAPAAVSPKPALKSKAAAARTKRAASSGRTGVRKGAAAGRREAVIDRHGNKFQAWFGNEPISPVTSRLKAKEAATAYLADHGGGHLVITVGRATRRISVPASRQAPAKRRAAS